MLPLSQRDSWRSKRDKVGCKAQRLCCGNAKHNRRSAKLKFVVRCIDGESALIVALIFPAAVALAMPFALAFFAFFEFEELLVVTATLAEHFFQ